MSLDFVYDLKEKLEEQGLEHLILVCRLGDKQSKLDLFFDLKSEESIEFACLALREVCSKLQNGEEIEPNMFYDTEEEDDSEGNNDEEDSE